MKWLIEVLLVFTITFKWKINLDYWFAYVIDPDLDTVSAFVYCLMAFCINAYISYIYYIFVINNITNLIKCVELFFFICIIILTWATIVFWLGVQSYPYPGDNIGQSHDQRNIISNQWPWYWPCMTLNLYLVPTP